MTVKVVNCSQIFCTFAVETTIIKLGGRIEQLWIALKFFVLLQSKQQNHIRVMNLERCELLSNFLYFCSRNNRCNFLSSKWIVVNCSQIFCTFAVETTSAYRGCQPKMVVNCSQIFCTFAVETTSGCLSTYWVSCELLSNFLYFCSRNN